MLNIVSNNGLDSLNELLSKLKNEYKNKSYISVINIFHEIKENTAFKDSYQTNLYVLYQIYSFVFAAYVILLDYEKALEIISEFYSYYIEICNLYTFALEVRKKQKKTQTETELKNQTIELINRLKSQFEIFNKDKYIEFYVNLAYANYKNKKYVDAIYYYDIAINKIEKSNNNKENLIDIYVGKSQSLYYHYNKKLNENGISDTIQEYINQIRLIDNSVAVLLSLAKLYYFIDKKDYAINYIELALDKINRDNLVDINYEIYAYDWLSRITYSAKQYASANKFYDKLISLIVEDKKNENYIDSKNKIIYPKPILADMVKFLNETNNLIAKKEASYVYKSIYIAIWASLVLEAAEIYSGDRNNIPIIIIMSFLVIISCILIHYIWK